LIAQHNRATRTFRTGTDGRDDAQFNLGPYQILARDLRLPTIKIRVDMIS